MLTAWPCQPWACQFAYQNAVTVHSAVRVLCAFRDPVYDLAWLQSKTGSEAMTVSSDGRVLWCAALSQERCRHALSYQNAQMSCQQPRAYAGDEVYALLCWEMQQLRVILISLCVRGAPALKARCCRQVGHAAAGGAR